MGSFFRYEDLQNEDAPTGGILDRYSWFRFAPLKVSEEFADLVLREVEKRGGKEAAAEWTGRLKHYRFHG